MKTPLALLAGSLGSGKTTLLRHLISATDVRQSGDHWVVSGRWHGEPLDPERHEQVVDVKAVTLHRFALEQVDDAWQAFVILDI